MKVAVLGAGGFVGRGVVRHFEAQGHEVRPILRRPRGLAGEIVIDDVLSADWAAHLEGVDVLVNSIARVHIVRDRAKDPLAEHRRINRDGAIRTAEGAIAAGLRRLVYISTIKVNGESSRPGQPFRADSVPHPEDAYGISKLEGERALFEIGRETGLEVTAVRPPLVHGPGARANLGALMQAIHRGLPLPLGRVTQNRRSLVGIDNLADLIVTLAQHPKAPGELFLAADGVDVSTRALVERLAAAMGRRPRLVPLPVPLIRAAASLLNKNAAVNRLLGSLQIDIAKNRDLLGWTPPVPFDEGLRRCVAPYRGE
jgi:nucleoside-diphosphate-sugar epimerase